MLKRLHTTKGVLIAWLLTAIFCWVYPCILHRGNNYKIFIGVYHHLIASKNLYIPYPLEYGDTNHYGPLFSLLIAPFALLPYYLGGLLWNIFNAGILVFAVYQLPLNTPKKISVLWICLLVFAHSQYEMQSNALTAALIILSFTTLLKQKEGIAALLIVSGFLIKLYPIVGGIFILFTPNKWRFLGWFALWLVVLFFLPAIFSSPRYIIQSYLDWKQSLTEKNLLNIALTSCTDYSVMGLFRRLFQDTGISNLPFLISGAVITGVGLLNFQLQSPAERYGENRLVNVKLYLLCSALLMVVLFSTGSESQTYIIAIAGCAIWLVLQERPFTGFNLALLLFILLFDGLGPTDLFPKVLRKFLIIHLVIMCWPCLVIWLKISLDLIRRKPGRNAPLPT